MAVELVFAPEVELDIEEAYQWYEDRRVGLGEEFLSCVEAGIQFICRLPENRGQTPIGLFMNCPYDTMH